MSATATNTIQLKDGRTLAYAEYGDPAGKPIFYFHGWPSSRLDFAPNHKVARSVGARVIAADRPGLGLSELKPNRTLLDWADDVAELANALVIDQFAVLGWSGGGPSALACAHKIPQRVTAVGLVAAMTHLDRPAATRGMQWFPDKIAHLLGRHAPSLLHLVLRPMEVTTKKVSIEKLLKQALKTTSKIDRAILSQPEVGPFLMASVQEAFRTDSHGVITDVVATANSWGFQVEDIQLKTYLWQGTSDIYVPLTMGKYYAETLPNCAANFYEVEGHMIFYSRSEEILSTLCAS